MNEKRRFGIPAIFAESGMEFPVGSKFHFSYSLGAVLRFNPGSQTRYSSGQLFENTVTTPTSTYSLVTTSTKAFNPCLKIEACAGFLFSEKLEGILSLYIQGGITEVAGETLILYNETMGTEYHQVAFKGTQAGIGLGFKFRK